MRTAHLALCVLALAFALPGPFAAAPLAHAASCSPIPHVVDIRCPPLPGAGAVAITSVPGFGFFVDATPNYACGAPVASGTTVTVQCTAAGACANPHAFAMRGDVSGTLGATADCGGVTATCQTTPLATWCMQQGLGAGSFPLTCTADVGTGSPNAFAWWVQCTVTA